MKGHTNLPHHVKQIVKQELDNRGIDRSVPCIVHERTENGGLRSANIGMTIRYCQLIEDFIRPANEQTFWRIMPVLKKKCGNKFDVCFEIAQGLLASYGRDRLRHECHFDSPYNHNNQTAATSQQHTTQRRESCSQ